MNYKMTAILKMIMDSTFDVQSKTDYLGAMSREFGLSEGANCLRQRLGQNDLYFSNAIKMLNFLDYGVYAEKDEKQVPIGSAAEAMAFVSSILAKQHQTKTEFAAKMGISYRGLAGLFVQPNIKAGTVYKMLNALGYSMIVKPKNNSAKPTYIVGEVDYSDRVVDRMYEEALSWADSKKNTHITFFDAFIDGNIVYDHNAQVSVKALYEQYVRFWEYNRELHPRTSDGEKEINPLSNKVFTEFVMKKFGGDGKRCYGITLKRGA